MGLDERRSTIEATTAAWALTPWVRAHHRATSEVDRARGVAPGGQIESGQRRVHGPSHQAGLVGRRSPLAGGAGPSGHRRPAPAHDGGVALRRPPWPW